MAKPNQFFVELPVTILREGKRYVAYSPALDLSTSGRTYPETRRRFAEAVEIFFEEVAAHGTLDQVLRDLGWSKSERRWQSPVLVGHEFEHVQLPPQ